MMSMLFILILAYIGDTHKNDVAISEGAMMHEFHLSKCDIDYSPVEVSLQIAISIFIDDLEMTLAKEGLDSLKICTKYEAPEVDSIIHDYIKKHLKVTVDDQLTEINWVGKEVSEDLAAVWSYLEIKNVAPQKSIEIVNDVLMESFDDQQNVVKLKMSDEKKSFFLFNINEFSGKLNLL